MNCYILKEGPSCLVVDPGDGGEAAQRRLLNALLFLGVAPGNVQLFITHLHLDHAGALRAEEFAACPVWLGCGELVDGETVPTRKNREEIRQRMRLEGFPREAVSLFDSNVWGVEVPDGRQVRMVSHGDVIDLNGRALRVLGVPGHTPGQVGLYDEQSKCLFAGDHLLFDIVPMLTMRCDCLDAVTPYLESLKHCCDLGALLLCPGHGVPQREWRNRAEQIASHHSQRIEQLRQWIAEQPGQTGADLILQKLWDEPIEQKRKTPYVRTVSILSLGCVYLNYLLVHGLVAYVVDQAGLRRYYPGR